MWEGDPRGWAEWYVRFWGGRRGVDDERQVRRCEWFDDLAYELCPLRTGLVSLRYESRRQAREAGGGVGCQVWCDLLILDLCVRLARNASSRVARRARRATSPIRQAKIRSPSQGEKSNPPFSCSHSPLPPAAPSDPFAQSLLAPSPRSPSVRDGQGLRSRGSKSRDQPAAASAPYSRSCTPRAASRRSRMRMWGGCCDSVCGSGDTS
jgi:hypothetical protein